MTEEPNVVTMKKIRPRYIQLPDACLKGIGMRDAKKIDNDNARKYKAGLKRQNKVMKLLDGMAAITFVVEAAPNPTHETRKKKVQRVGDLGAIAEAARYCYEQKIGDVDPEIMVAVSAEHRERAERKRTVSRQRGESSLTTMQAPPNPPAYNEDSISLRKPVTAREMDLMDALNGRVV